MARVSPAAAAVQGLAAASITSLNALTAFTFAWPSYTVEMYTSRGTVLAAPMSGAQAALLASLPSLAALLATPLAAPAMQRFGCKRASMLFGLPFVVCWAAVWRCRSAWSVVAALGAAGAGAAGQAVGAVFIAELAQDALRGALCSTIVSGYFAGLLVSYALAALLPYRHVALAHLGLSLLYILSLTLLKESPVYLLRHSREQEACIAIAFYRQVDVSSQIVRDEVKKIKAQLQSTITPTVAKETELQLTSALITPESIQAGTDGRPTSEWRFLLGSRSSQRALAAAAALTVASVLMGGVALQVYAEPLFAAAVPGASARAAGVGLALALLAGSLAGGALLERCGRRALLRGSALGAGLGAAALAAQLQSRWGPPWLSAVLIYAYSFAYNTGAAVVPFVLSAEIFLPEVRGLCNSIVLACLWGCYCVALGVFRPLQALVGLPALLYGFAAAALLTAAAARRLPETRGLSALQIQALFTSDADTYTT